MEPREIVLQPVGWNGEHFVTEEVEIQPEDASMLRGKNVLFESADVLLKDIAIYVGQDNIVGFEASLTSGRKNQFGHVPAKPTPEVKFHKFEFQSEEAITKLDLYYNFSGHKIGDLPRSSGPGGGDVEAGPVEGQDAPDPEVSQSLSFLFKQGVQGGGTSELSLAAGRCCGIAFTTSKRRKFKAMSWRTLGFQTRCEVDVASGLCCGIITNVTENVSLLGMLFVKEQSEQGTGGDPNQAPLIGSSQTVEKPGRKSQVSVFHRVVKGWKRFVLRFFAASFLASLTTIRMLIFQLVMPLYDIASDGMAAYCYFREQVENVGLLIVLFILMPHIIQTLSLIYEMIIQHGEFDEYPKALVRFYKAALAPRAILSNIIKFATAPFFTILNFIWFIGTVLQNGWVLLQELLFVGRFVAGVARRHADDLREKNVKQDSWSKVIFNEVWFESFPQFTVQLTSVITLYGSSDSVQSYPIYASIVVSAIMLLRQAWIFTGFMLKTSLSFVNSVRIVFSSALDFFPIFSLYSNTVRHTLFRFYNNPVLLELWGPLCNIMREVSSLKSITVYLEQGEVWFNMSMQMLDSIAKNENLNLEMIDICVEDNTDLVVARKDDLKKRMYGLLTKEKTQKIYLLIHAGADLGIMEESVEETTKEQVIDRGIRWTWKSPGGRTARIEYCLELAN